MGTGAQRLRNDRPVEHRSIDDDRLGLAAVKDNPAARGREDLRAMDLPDDRLLARHDVEDAGGYETTALNGLANLPMFLNERDVITCLRNRPRGVASGGPSTDNDDVELLRPGGQPHPSLFL